MSTPTSSHRHAEAVPTPSLVDLGHGFHAYVQLDGSWGLNNCGIYIGETGVVLVDTVFTEHRARHLRAAVRGLTDRPVRTVVNTHSHGDHTYGNFVFDEATLIGHERCREAIVSTGLETTGWFPDVDFGAIELRPPFVTFGESLHLYCDDTRADLWFAGPAHTDNDIVVWVEEHGLLFAGDLIFNGGTPFALMGSVLGSIRRLEELRALPISRVVPGHGPVCGPEVIDAQLSYFHWLVDVGNAALADGIEPLEAARGADLGPFAGWTDQERLVGNLHRYLSERRGEPGGSPLEYQRIVDEMVELNHGQPLRCLA